MRASRAIFSSAAARESAERASSQSDLQVNAISEQEIAVVGSLPGGFVCPGEKAANISNGIIAADKCNLFFDTPSGFAMASSSNSREQVDILLYLRIIPLE
jgi:hypothetical protein